MIFSLFFLVAISILCVSCRTTTRKDDAFHFTKDPHDNLVYVEWWYFNWACENGKSGIYVYGIWNPSDEFDVGMTILYALHYSNDSVQHTADLHHTDAFSASYDEADVTILKTNTIRVKSDSEYSVIGSSVDKTASWNFNISAVVEPWFFYENSSMGHNDELSWLVYMPEATVSGTAFFGGETHEIDECSGYHDHDWGRWDPFAVTWAWLQFNNEDVVLVGGSGRESGKYSVANNLWFKRKKDNLFVKFTPEECRVYFSNFVKSDLPLHEYPKNVQYTCSSDKYDIDLKWEVINSPGIWKAAVFVFEQKSEFNGVLKDKAGQVVSEWTGVGFSEWTDPIL